MKTYWNGEQAKCTRVTVTVADKGTFEKPWFKLIVGSKAWPAVEVGYGGSCFYLDDSDGVGWAKVTTGKGSPMLSHRELEIEESDGAYER